MQTITEIALEKAVRGVFTREQAALWVDNNGSRLNSLLKRAVAKHEIWRIRRGLYILSDRFMANRINSLELAQRIYGPSYVSLETALSYHGWIPEAVYAVTSVALDRARSFTTPLGLFTFTHVPQKSFLSGVRRHTDNKEGAFFIATPLKALADYVYTQHYDWQYAKSVLESLRIEDDSLNELRGELFDEVMAAYKPGRTYRFLAALRKELQL